MISIETLKTILLIGAIIIFLLFVWLISKGMSNKEPLKNEKSIQDLIQRQDKDIDLD